MAKIVLILVGIVALAILIVLVVAQNQTPKVNTTSNGQENGMVDDGQSWSYYEYFAELGICVEQITQSASAPSDDSVVTLEECETENNVVRNNLNEELCETLYTEPEDDESLRQVVIQSKNDCYSAFAVAKRDVSICDKVSNEFSSTSASNCKSSYQAQLN